jgi:dTDP-glucose pyrophosphorylase
LSGEEESAQGGVAELLVRENVQVRAALKQMDLAAAKILFVVGEDRRLFGSLTDGDIRRWILKEGSLQEPVSELCNRHPKVVRMDADVASIRELMLRNKIEVLPVVDEHDVVVDVYLWTDVFAGEATLKGPALGLPVVVMAGGRSTRLEPLTKILPKPLIPLGEKPIVELIMDRFAEFGCHDFYLTLNYKGRMIESYFNHSECPYEVKFVWEDEFLGTAGSLRLATPMIAAPHLFVSNCDILILADYGDIYNFHRQNDHDITVVGSVQHLSVPFGVLEVKDGGYLETIVEKPEFDFLANTGMYLIKTGVVDLIPPATRTDFPELLTKVKAAGGKIGVYPVTQQSWTDIGQWQEYQDALRRLEQKK